MYFIAILDYWIFNKGLVAFNGKKKLSLLIILTCVVSVFGVDIRTVWETLFTS